MNDPLHRPIVDLRKGDADDRSTPGGTWAPGAPPTLASTASRDDSSGRVSPGTSHDAVSGWSAGGAPPPVPVGNPRPQRNVPVLIAAGFIAVLVLGAIVAFVVTAGTDPEKRSAAASAPSAASTTVQMPLSLTSDTGAPAIPNAGGSTPAGADESSSAETSSVPPEPTDPGQRYSGPGGLSVTGPSGWVADYSANVSNIRDYIAPDSSERLAGPALRVGIGNDGPSGAFTDEVGQAAKFLRSRYDARIIGSAHYGSFLGATSADVQYVYTVDDLGVVRRGIERLWRNGGVTMIIQASGLEDDWPTTLARFRQMIASAALN